METFEVLEMFDRLSNKVLQYDAAQYPLPAGLHEAVAETLAKVREYLKEE